MRGRQVRGVEGFDRTTFEQASDGERWLRCARLATVISDRVRSADDFSGRVEELVGELRSAGHDLWSFDSDGETFEVWRPDYARTGPGIIVTFRVDGPSEVAWPWPSRWDGVPAVVVPEEVAARIRSLVASTPTGGGHIDNEAARYGGVAVMGTIGAVWLLRPNGTLWEVDDDSGRPIFPLSPEWHHAALACGAERHPWLAELVPPRAADARSCAMCSGNGRLPVVGCSDPRGIFCPECHARGWHPPR
jgi:hypothetical protein